MRLNSIAVRRAYFPRPQPAEDAPRQLPVPFYKAPAVILLENARCQRFCGLSQEQQNIRLAQAVQEARQNGEDVVCTEDLDLEFCL